MASPAAALPRHLARFLAAVLLCALWLSQPGVAADRLALVVGNGTYEAAPDLKNPVADATAVAEALTRLGFKVTLLTDVGGSQFWADLDAFTAAAGNADSTVFYYSGHAFQMSGVNYLVPVTARLQSRETIAEETWSLDAIIARLQSRSRQTLIFVDACRNDPLPPGVRGSGAASDGLARVQTGVGTFVAFATEPGGVTADGVGDAAHSPFTTALLKHIETVGISVSDMMIEVRNDVENATLRKQVPWDQSSLRAQFYFVPPQEGGRQELSEADYELLAQLSPEDRQIFMDLLAESGFDKKALEQANAEIALAEANLEVVANQAVVLAVPDEDAEKTTEDTADTGDTTGVPKFEIAKNSVIIVAVPEDDPPKQDSPAPIRLAALNWDTRDIAINEVTIERLRLEGKVLQPDNEQDRAVLAAIAPDLLQDIPEAIAPADLAKAVQAQLKRVGCYQMGVDGDWGKGSRTALTSYYLAKKIVPTTLEPTSELHDRLSVETSVVCKVRVASSAVATGKRAKVTQTAVRADPKNDTIKGRQPGSKKPLESKETKIKKAGIGMTGSF